MIEIDDFLKMLTTISEKISEEAELTHIDFEGLVEEIIGLK